VRPQPEPGSVAEETARLFEALQEAATTWSHGGRPASPAAHGHGQTPAACRVCPLCQLVGVVQNLRPETVQHLADAAASLAAAVSDLAAGVAARSGGASAAPRAPDGARSHGTWPDDGSWPEGERSRAPDVQHIDITD
jgi:hypothetical protein